MKKILAIGTSPFIYASIKDLDNSSITVFDNSKMQRFGGMWSNIDFNGAEIEFAPHLIELENISDKEKFEKIFKRKFIINKNKTFFCFKSKKYNIEKTIDRFILILNKLLYKRYFSIEWLRKQKRFLFTKKKFIEPEEGHKEIGSIVDSFFRDFKKLNLKKENIKKINITENSIDVFFGDENQKRIQFDLMLITRGISSCDIFFEGKNISDYWSKNIIVQNTLIKVNNKLPHKGKYYKFLNEKIDRIAKVKTEEDFSLFVVQIHVDSKNEYSNIEIQQEIIKTMKKYNLISKNKIEIIKTYYGYNSSFAISDNDFNKLLSILPQNVRLIDSKAFSPYLLDIVNNENI